jgi:hypothetical protein
VLAVQATGPPAAVTQTWPVPPGVRARLPGDTVIVPRAGEGPPEARADAGTPGPAARAAGAAGLVTAVIITWPALPGEGGSSGDDAVSADPRPAPGPAPLPGGAPASAAADAGAAVDQAGTAAGAAAAGRLAAGPAPPPVSKAEEAIAAAMATAVTPASSAPFRRPRGRPPSAPAGVTQGGCGAGRACAAASPLGGTGNPDSSRTAARRTANSR